jgi:hypothetical protein
MIYYLILLLIVGVSFVTQAFIPTIDWAFAATLLAVHMVFFAGAVTVSYPAMLLLAFVTGFAWDALQVVPSTPVTPSAIGAIDVDGFREGPRSADVSFGYSILLFGLAGSMMQGIRPLFRRGRWELPVLMTGVVTVVYLTLEYALINFMRGDLYFPREVWFKILTTAMLTTLAAPVLFLALHWIARMSGYRIRYEGLSRRYA